jgi:hypothetical protein
VLPLLAVAAGKSDTVLTIHQTSFIAFGVLLDGALRRVACV